MLESIAEGLTCCENDSNHSSRNFKTIEFYNSLHSLCDRDKLLLKFSLWHVLGPALRNTAEWGRNTHPQIQMMVSTTDEYHDRIELLTGPRECETVVSFRSIQNAVENARHSRPRGDKIE